VVKKRPEGDRNRSGGTAHRAVQGGETWVGEGSHCWYFVEEAEIRVCGTGGKVVVGRSRPNGCERERAIGKGETTRRSSVRDCETVCEGEVELGKKE